MRRRDPLTADERRELDALDRALAGEPVDADLRALEALVHDVRATAPTMSPAFEARLGRELASGLAAPPAAPAEPPRRWWRRPTLLLSAAGTLAAALVALVVVLGHEPSSPEVSHFSGDSQELPRPAAESGAGAQADRPAADPPAPAVPQAGRAAPPVAPPVTAAPGVPRRVERSAELVLETPARRLERTADRVLRTVDRFGGIVASSTSTADERGGEAAFELRIPTARLDDALAALSRLGHVAERRQDLQDITASFVSLQDRLADARAERRGLLRALGRATTKAQIDSLRARLRIARATIGRLNGDIASLRRRADLARVGVTVRGVQGGGAGGGWSPREAIGDALRVLEVMAAVAVVALAVAVPLALLVVAVALAARVVRRRERERALDPA